MLKPIDVKALPDYKLWIKYSDGTAGEVDLSHLAGRGVFKLWDNYQKFQAVHIAEDGAITWNDQVDLCPDSIYLKLTDNDQLLDTESLAIQNRWDGEEWEW